VTFVWSSELKELALGGNLKTLFALSIAEAKQPDLLTWSVKKD
jgi:hypothetical protein